MQQRVYKKPDMPEAVTGCGLGLLRTEQCQQTIQHWRTQLWANIMAEGHFAHAVTCDAFAFFEQFPHCLF